MNQIKRNKKVQAEEKAYVQGPEVARWVTHQRIKKASVCSALTEHRTEQHETGLEMGQELYGPQEESVLFPETNEELLKSSHQGSDMGKFGL